MIYGSNMIARKCSFSNKPNHTYKLRYSCTNVIFQNIEIHFGNSNISIF